jgi:ABC-type lipoprotein release transport system permease subunit
VIVSIAILSSVVGALVPAMRAARMNPVEALRFE